MMQLLVSVDDPGQQQPMQDLFRVRCPVPQEREHELHEPQLDHEP